MASDRKYCPELPLTGKSPGEKGNEYMTGVLRLITE